MTQPEHLGGDRWRIRVYTGKDIHGQRQRVSRSFRADGIRAARNQVAILEAAIRTDATHDRDRRATVNGMVDEWLSVKKRAASTEYRNRSIVAAIRAGLGDLPVDKVTARDIDLWYGRLLADGMSETTVNHYHRVLHSMFLRAERWTGVIAPTRRAEPPRANKPNPSPPATTDLAKVIADASPALQLAAFLSAQLGLRRGEVCGLRWGDIRDGRVNISRSIADVPGRALEVKSPKTKQNRSLAVDAATIAVLERRRGGRLDGWVLEDPFDPDMPRRPGWVTQAWNRLCRKHGVRIRFHDLRHWAATNMIDAGIPISTVSARLGHSLTSTTVNVYTKALPGSDELAAAALAARLPAPLEATGVGVGPSPVAHVKSRASDT